MKRTLLAVSALLATASFCMAQEDLGYTPIEGDYQATVPNCSGVYLNNGFSLSLYGAPIDDQGFICGAGDLINLEFYTAEPGTEDFKIAGVYNFYDTQAWMDKTTDVKYGPGDLMGGILYEMMPGYVFPMGSMVAVYDEEMNETLGLVGPGSSLTVTDKGNGVYNLAVDIYTYQNAHITAEWEGVLADYVEDCPEVPSESSAVKEFPADSGFQDQTAVSEYYDLQGVEVANPQPGNLYIQVTGDKAVKVLR